LPPWSVTALRSLGAWWSTNPSVSSQRGSDRRRILMAALPRVSGGQLLSVSYSAAVPSSLSGADLRPWQSEVGRGQLLRTDLVCLAVEGRVWRTSTSSASRRGTTCVDGAISVGEAHGSLSARPSWWGLRCGASVVRLFLGGVRGGRCGGLLDAQRAASPTPLPAEV
jgi:hypothetical protein